MAKILLVLLLFVSLSHPAHSQAADTPAAYLTKIQAVIASECLGTRLVRRLDSLQAKHIPSRSYVNVNFNRAIDLGFKQYRLAMSLNFYRFQVNLLCRHDTIFLRTIAWEENEKYAYQWYNQPVIEQFLQKRNQLYGSAKTASQLLSDLAAPIEYAFYCGDGAPKTERGAAIERLVAKRKYAELLAMLQSFNCENQAYGVAGLRLLQQRGYQLPSAVQALIEHIKARNSELLTCSGCLSGLVEKIYAQP